MKLKKPEGPKDIAKPMDAAKQQAAQTPMQGAQAQAVSAAADDVPAPVDAAHGDLADTIDAAALAGEDFVDEVADVPEEAREQAAAQASAAQAPPASRPAPAPAEGKGTEDKKEEKQESKEDKKEEEQEKKEQKREEKKEQKREEKKEQKREEKKEQKKEGKDKEPERFLSVTTPLGKSLSISGLRGEERLSAPFHFVLDLYSRERSIDFTKIVGKSVTVQVLLADKSKRYINGVVTRFTQGGSDKEHTLYHAELRPWLWLLSLTTDSRIFQKKSTPEILEAVFSELGFKDVKKALKGSYAKREYCVQYQETSLDFVSRLMEEEGIFYFFEHEKDKHTLVLADDADAHKPCPGMKAAVIGNDPWKIDDLITECSFEEQVVPNAYALSDYNFEIPATDLSVKKSGKGSPTLTIYDYPGLYEKKAEGEGRGKLRLESCAEAQKLLRGLGACRAFVSGYKFKLKGHERDDLNAEYVLRAVYHTASAQSYANRFEAMPATVPFRPPLFTRRPVIAGTQTALVVGKSGEEIWTDKYGRIKVQFHWDRKGKKDENSSCWVRVAQGWAGKGWGAWFLPRVGQEVVVSFLDGNPDRPLVTGAVYNAQQKVPYALPDNQTKSTIKSSSSKGGGGFNEIRFEDKKGKEEIFIHAQKDMKVTVKHDLTTEVGNDEKRTVKNSRTTEIQEKDDTLTIKKGKRIIKVEKGDETHDVKGKRALTITGDEAHTNKANFTHDVKGDYTLKVKGNLVIDVTGEVTIKSAKGVKIAAKMDLDMKGQNIKAKADMDVAVKAGMNLKGEGGMQLQLKGGAMAKVEGGGMLSLKGGMVKIN